MKIRLGFVSNSLSSSFVIRGIKIKKQDLCKIWKIKQSEYIKDPEVDIEGCDKFDYYDVLVDVLYLKAKGFSLKFLDLRDYLDDDKTDDCIVGVEICSLSDYEIKELEDPDDYEIEKKLEKAGIEVEELKTYIQCLIH